MDKWKILKCPISELKLGITLACGQSFRWKETSPGVWTNVLAGKVWKLKQTENQLMYKVYEGTSKQCKMLGSSNSVVNFFEMADKNEKTATSKVKIGIETSSTEQRNASAKGMLKHIHVTKKQKRKASAVTDNEAISDKQMKIEAKGKTETAEIEDIKLKARSVGQNKIELNYEATLRDYFQLDINLQSLYAKWIMVDDHFRSVASDFTGTRILRQDPVENLFSFICSSNNHISRISGMVERLCAQYGEKILEVDGVAYFSFPTVESLAQAGVEEKLRALGFGYRAKYISQTAKYIVEHHNSEWLYSLRTLPYEEAHKELTKLYGVGAKVADCVCLMSLDKTGAIPVDTHVWQIAQRDYKLSKLNQTKSLTDATYKEIGHFFRSLWGDYAGWAHSVLFSADLKKFQDRKTKK